LWFAVGAILLIAGVNLSNLLLARAAARAKEFAVRGALGASRGRTVRQLLMESLVLSGIGALVGLGLALVLIRWLAHQGSFALPLLSTLRIDGQTLAWTVLVAVFTAIVVGLIPGLRITSGNLQEVLKDSGAGAGLGRKHERVRATLVIAEIALTCVLLVSAGLLLRSFTKVLQVDLGFQPDRAAVIKLDYDDTAPTGEASAMKRGAIFQQLIAKVSTVPGVGAAGIGDYLPLGPNRSWDAPAPKGKAFAPGELPEPLVYVVTPGFLRAMGIGLHGRDFTWSDGPNNQKVVLINASAARLYWPGEDAVGKVLVRGKEEDLVIGVVDDVHEESVEGNVGSQIYYPVTQQSPSWAQLVVRSNLPPETLGMSVLRALRELNPSQPANEFRPVRRIVEHAVSARRFFMLLVAAFAGLGLVLATLGIYGVISYSVTRQTPEIGIRMALGASTGLVQRQVLVGTLRLALAGVALGTLMTLAVAKVMASLLFATSPWDLPSYLGMALALLLVAVASGYIPARRASSINPMDALRSN
jgi:predicted permease